MYRAKRVNIFFVFLVLALVLFMVWIFRFKEEGAALKPRCYLFKQFSFCNENELKEWDEKVLKGHVGYTVENFGNNSCVYARSRNNASALYYKIKIDMERHPVLSWRWNVIKFPQKTAPESLTDTKEDDYGARMYIIFPPSLFGGIKALEYVWTEQLPNDTISSSPYTSNIKLVVLESGYNKEGEWVCEKRDLYEDYLKAFDKKPKSNIGAIAIMTDSDSTGTCAEAVYDEIIIEYKK